MITTGGTGALIGIAQSYLRNKSALVFEPYYPYHRQILEEFGAKTETFELDKDLTFEKDALLKKCKELKDRSRISVKSDYRLHAGESVGQSDDADGTRSDCRSRAGIGFAGYFRRSLRTLCLRAKIRTFRLRRLPGMWERTVTVNSFSKSWNISGWRLGYAYGHRQICPADQ